MKTVVYWITKDAEKITAISDKFNLPTYTSLNGETLADVNESDMDLLRECEKRGLIQIRNKV